MTALSIIRNNQRGLLFFPMLYYVFLNMTLLCPTHTKKKLFYVYSVHATSQNSWVGKSHARVYLGNSEDITLWLSQLIYIILLKKYYLFKYKLNKFNLYDFIKEMPATWPLFFIKKTCTQYFFFFVQLLILANKMPKVQCKSKHKNKLYLTIRTYKWMYLPLGLNQKKHFGE